MCAASASRDLSAFRRELYHCVTARTDAVFELIDAMLCAGGPVRPLPELSLVAGHRRGHGSVGIARIAADADVLQDTGSALPRR